MKEKIINCEICNKLISRKNQKRHNTSKIHLIKKENKELKNKIN